MFQKGASLKKTVLGLHVSIIHHFLEVEHIQDIGDPRQSFLRRAVQEK